MKKLLPVFIIIILSAAGCDSIFNMRRITILNEDRDKYITSVYYRISSYGGDKWSRNQISADIEPGESFVMTLGYGTYDFKVIMEDDYYSYTMYERGVIVDNDFTLGFCYDCLGESDKEKVEKIPKEKQRRND